MTSKEKLDFILNNAIFPDNMDKELKKEVYEKIDDILKDLERLEAIDNANPSEALKCLKNNSELFDKIAKENPTTYKNETFAEAFLFKTNTVEIEQALLKAQKQDKILEILNQLKEILSMDYLVRVYGYEMAKRLQTYLKSNDIVRGWLDGKD